MPPWSTPTCRRTYVVNSRGAAELCTPKDLPDAKACQYGSWAARAGWPPPSPRLTCLAPSPPPARPCARPPPPAPPPAPPAYAYGGGRNHHTCMQAGSMSGATSGGHVKSMMSAPTYSEAGTDRVKGCSGDALFMTIYGRAQQQLAEPLSLAHLPLSSPGHCQWRGRACYPCAPPASARPHPTPVEQCLQGFW